MSTLNPYSGEISQWQPGATRAWFEGFTDLAPLPIIPGRHQSRQPDWWLYGLIMEYQVPVLRRVLETVSVFDFGMDPVTVTATLDGLRSKKHFGGYEIVRSEIRLGKEAKRSHLYTHNREPRAAEIAELRRLYRERELVLSNNTLRAAGESYFRGVLKASGRFESVTPAAKLGRVRDGTGDNALDLMATDAHSNERYGISVKNLREWLRPDDRAIKDVVKKAAAHNVKPWLVVPFAFDGAIKRCEDSGIRITLLGRQIVPAEDHNKRRMRDVVRDLRAVIGSQPLDYMYARFDRTLERSPLARSDVAAVASLDD